MEKTLKVVHHVNQLGLGGTEKTAQIFCRHLDHARFEAHLLAPRFPVPLLRLLRDRLRAFLGSSKARERVERYGLMHSRLPDFEKILGKERIHFYTPWSLPRVMRKLAPDILHVHSSGASEPPVNCPEAVRNVPVMIATNIFGFEDKTPHQKKIGRILFISEWLKNDACWAKDDLRAGVLYNPVERPLTNEDLRAELGIGQDVVVIGRIGRNADDIHDPVSLKAYKEAESGNTLFLAVSPPPRMVEEAKALGLKNFRALPPSVDDVFLSRFYNTIDVLAHARFDGETFGCTIAEAMIHGKPVITHRSEIRNAQSELLDASSGFVTGKDDWQDYAAKMKLLIHDAELRKRMGEAARTRALQNFEAGLVTRKLEKVYLEELEKVAESDHKGVRYGRRKKT